MAKKSSRKSRKQRKTNVPQYTPPTESQQEAEQEAKTVVSQPVAAAAPAAAKKPVGAGMDSIDWLAEYPYVVGDLRSMGIVAALMVAMLLGLNLFLN